MWTVVAGMLLALSPDPFIQASQATQIPVPLLRAISRVESAHHPWALNLNGRGLFLQNRQEAERMINGSSDDIDIGHMQVHYRTWRSYLGLTKTQLLDPYLNAWAGAVILRYYLSRYPFWEAIGRYHSDDRERQIGYAWRVYQALLAEDRRQ